MPDDEVILNRTSANKRASRSSKQGMESAALAISPYQGSSTRNDQAISRSDHAWIKPIIDTEGPAILRMLWRILGQEQDVLDAYQDCFCKLVVRGKSSDLKNIKAYAYRTASNIAIEMLRSRKRRAEHWPRIAVDRSSRDPDPDPDLSIGQETFGPERSDGRHGVASSQAANRLQQALVQLPTHLRNVVVLRDLSKMSYEQVGRTLGIEPTTARVYRRHAIIKLADLIKEDENA